MSEQDFILFKEYFAEYLKLFGLTGYKVYFKYEPLEKSFANISINQGGMVVTVRLNSQLPAEHKDDLDIRGDAKHEALHLLIGRLGQNGRYRFASDDEMTEAEEELVYRLEGLI